MVTTAFNNKYRIKIDNKGRLYQQNTLLFLPEKIKSFGVYCYCDDFYLINKNTIGLKKHIYDNENWSPDKFKQYLIDKYQDLSNKIEEQFNFEKCSITQVDSFNNVVDPCYLFIVDEIKEDDPFYNKALEAYRENA